MSLLHAFSISDREAIINIYYGRVGDGECRKCEKGFYSKTANEELQVTECKKCPAEAETCEGSNIVMSPGFWSINDNSDSLSPCPMGAAACPGGVAARTDTSTATASDSYSRIRG